MQSNWECCSPKDGIPVKDRLPIWKYNKTSTIDVGSVRLLSAQFLKQAAKNHLLAPAQFLHDVVFSGKTFELEMGVKLGITNSLNDEWS